MSHDTSSLALIGAGPKSMAVIAKAHALAQLGFPTPQLTLFEKNGVAHHWKPNSGYTNGNLPLGTSPEKDIGFPYHSFCWGDSINRQVNAEMLNYSWQSFYVETHRYSDWIDRGKPAPQHKIWAEYLKWVFEKVKSQVNYVPEEVTKIDIKDNQWLINTRKENQFIFDGLMMTGPGKTRLPVDMIEHPRVLKTETFWKNVNELTQLPIQKIAIVGAGENSATVAVSLGQANPEHHIDIISPHAMTYTRGESYAENHLYTDPFQGNWFQLTKEHRKRFINQTDRGVFSVEVKRSLDALPRIETIPGVCTSIKTDSLEQLICEIKYHDEQEERVYDLVVITTGFDHFSFLTDLLSENAKSIISENLISQEITPQGLTDQVDENLCVENLTPALHLPMMAGLNQGPGFANLSCLGRLSDHILARYVPSQFHRMGIGASS